MITILYYDLNEVLIKRYPKRIALSLQARAKHIRHIFVYSEVYQNELNEFPEIENSSVFYLPKLRSLQLQKICIDYKVSVGIVCAQRIPDMWLLAFLKTHGVSTYLVQHGLWADHLQRIPLPILIVSKLSKFINYTTYSLFISKHLKLNWILFLSDLYKFLLIEEQGFKDLPTLDSASLGAGRVFAFDDSWSDYYCEKYGYNFKQIDYIGNPDVLMLKDISTNYNSNKFVVYIAQTLVEDGRMAKKSFQTFLRRLTEVCRQNGKTLVVRRHPRTRNEIYSEVSDMIIITDELPACPKYIGHYSGLLSTVKMISRDIFLWHFENHHFPVYFKRFGRYFGSSWKILEQWIVTAPEDEVKICFPELENPIENITQKLLHYENVTK